MQLSFIIPVHNGSRDLTECLQALARSTRLPDEIVVADDASSDASAVIAAELGARVIHLPGGPNGPAAARNMGATNARGDTLVFIDSDVAVHPDTLERIEAYLSAHDDVAALFGSYDNTPPKPGLISRYKNLQHHFTHQQSQREATTFWAGCGAVRRNIFLATGGYDTKYGRPSIEDIELGVRLRRSGHRIWLCPDVQVTHLKRWTLASWLRADIRDRAIPWTRLILAEARLPTDLGLDLKSQLSAVAVWLIVIAIGLGFWLPWAWLAVPVLVGGLVALNASLYRLFARQGGANFAAGAIALHSLFYLYSSFIFGSLLVWHGLSKLGEVLISPFRLKKLVEDPKHDRS